MNIGDPEEIIEIPDPLPIPDTVPEESPSTPAPVEPAVPVPA